MMKLKKRTTRMLSIIMAISMIMGILSLSAMAYEPGEALDSTLSNYLIYPDGNGTKLEYDKADELEHEDKIPTYLPTYLPQ